MMFFLLLPKATKLGTFQRPLSIGTFQGPNKMLPHWPPNLEPSKGQQVGVFLLLPFKGVNLDHLTLYFQI
jgi:hypothetical protein